MRMGKRDEKPNGENLVQGELHTRSSNPMHIPCERLIYSRTFVPLAGVRVRGTSFTCPEVQAT